MMVYMEKEEYLKEKIGLLKAEMGHLWNGALVSTGGSVTLILNGNYTILSISFMIIGIVLTVFLFNAYFMRRVEIGKIINNMEKHK